MFINNYNVETKTLRIISLILTLIGIIFILASNHVGNIAIRITMFIIFFVILLNFNITYLYSSKIEKTYMAFGVIGTVVVFIMPQLTMFIIGIVLLTISFPNIYKMIRTKNYSDKIMLTISIIGTLFSIYCILNSRAALNTVIIMIGIAFLILGCIMFFTSFNINKHSHKSAHNKTQHKEGFRFIDVEEIDEKDNM